MNRSLPLWCLFIAWTICVAALLATLYGSEILQLPVCVLCWYQRICLYPLVIILGIAAFRMDSYIVPYVIVLPILSSVFSLYQYLEQMIPGFEPINVCTMGVECSTIHFKFFGFITYPFLGLLASIVITLLLIIAYLTQKNRDCI